MKDHQHTRIERARIAWHEHQFEHDCYGLECTEDRRLYLTYQRAITAGTAEPGQRPGREEKASPDT